MAYIYFHSVSLLHQPPKVCHDFYNLTDCHFYVKNIAYINNVK